MSVALARLRKRAAELEQKKQFDRALEVYMQILDEGGKDLDDEDVPLFNRVGDMLMRNGSVTEALGYYERAVDMYAERGYLNNAIALCSKILRQSPGRAAVYYKLARISAKKGFKSDARKNFLEYADRMQKLGMAEEAFRALKEFASLYPDQDDVRLVLAELLSKENRKGEALEQLQSLYEKLQSEGRGAEARATIDRMRAIDPNATPREGTEAPRAAPAGDLVFLARPGADARPRAERTVNHVRTY
jgi:tetratricopeptide (TPR) repeat protein